MKKTYLLPLLSLLLGACGSQPEETHAPDASTDTAEARVDEQLRTAREHGLLDTSGTPPLGTREEGTFTEEFPEADLKRASGAAAPDFSLATLAGDPFRLSEKRGQVVVVNFWATWCPPCLKEIPDLVAMQKELGGQGVQIVGVSEDEEGFAAVRPFATRMNMNYPVVIDEAGKVAASFGDFEVLPTTYVVDRQGRLRYFGHGMITREKLRPILLGLLE